MMTGRIGAVVDNEAVIKYVADRMGITDEIECAGHGRETSYIYIAFSPANPNAERYSDILSKGIVRLRENGELLKILSKYGLSDWK